jgi:hypothetical protein
MIKEFIDRFENKKSELQTKFQKQPGSYEDIVKSVVEVISGDAYDDIDPERIHKIDDGDYQGTLLFVIAAKGYQPSKYWAVSVGYGSCSGCDTLAAIAADGDWDSPPNDQQISDYMTLALHIVQGLKQITN